MKLNQMKRTNSASASQMIAQQLCPCGQSAEGEWHRRLGQYNDNIDVQIVDRFDVRATHVVYWQDGETPGGKFRWYRQVPVAQAPTALSAETQDYFDGTWVSGMVGLIAPELH